MESIKGLIPFVQTAGKLAVERQRLVTRSYKADGSILTQVDRELDQFLRDSIVSLYPESNVITEENPAGSETEVDFTFAVDPIDGTDCYSQGMPGWAISIGLLDRNLSPIAGILFAPKWGPEVSGGVLFFADIGKEALLNGEEIPQVEPELHRPALTQVMVGSSIHRRCDMRTFEGKVRNAGSTVAHIFAPLIHRAVVGTILSPNYVWDIAGAHAVVKSKGLLMEYLGGEPIDYRPLAARKRAPEMIVSGTRAGLDLIRTHFRPFH